ncbi:hypothetical protein FN846DRAFT_718019 [Sphaerosporella brunnea]|uniref:Calcofluor white hypersensitive protein n=1 Tax=Sphaerosporella brunnea TaxID=1250544 RepID=A0A5J5EY72_9PEZI|nr:hypothetical protein FN846DRAFT_718019 [Sphaerosporella brunnea]
MTTSPRTDIPKAGPPKNRIPLILGLGAAGVLGYYFYTAGGDLNIAKKAAEHDAAKVSSSIRDELPGREKEVKTGAEETMARAGATIDSKVEEGKQRIAEGVQRLDQGTQSTKSTVLGKIDEADRKIEAEAAKAKGGIMSWFGWGK